MILAEKIQGGIQIGTNSQTEEKNTASIKANPLDYFLNESFVRDFIELHLYKFNLSEFKILNCKINRLKSKRRKPAIEFKLQLVNSKQNQQPIYKSIVGKWSSDEYCKQVFDLLEELWDKGFDGGNDHLKICEPIAIFLIMTL